MDLEYIGTDLSPSAEYLVLVCAWSCSEGQSCIEKKSHSWSRSISDSPPTLTGRGPRICRHVTVHTPPEVPIELAVNEFEPQLLDTNFQLNQKPSQFYVDFIQDRAAISALLPNIDSYDAILSVRGELFMTENEPIKFGVSSRGSNLLRVSELPPGCSFEADFRFVNKYGLGPVISELNKDQAPRERQEISTPEDEKIFIDRVSAGADKTLQICFKSFESTRYDNQYNLEGIVLRSLEEDTKLEWRPISARCISGPMRSVNVLSSQSFKIGTVLIEPSENYDLPPPFVYGAHRTEKSIKLFYASRTFLLYQKHALMVNINRYPIRYNLQKMKVLTTSTEVDSSGEFELVFARNCDFYPEYCNMEAQITFSYVDFEAEHSLAVFVTAQNVKPWSSSSIQKQLKKPELFIATDMRTNLQNQFAVVHVIEPKVATGYEWALQYEIAAPYGISCSSYKFNDKSAKSSHNMILPRANCRLLVRIFNPKLYFRRVTV